MTSYLKDLDPCPCVRPKSNSRCEDECEAAGKAEDLMPAVPKDEKRKGAIDFLKEVSNVISAHLLLKPDVVLVLHVVISFYL